MGWIEEFRRRASAAGHDETSAEDLFAEAARQRWLLLGDELRADVAEFNQRSQGAEFSRPEDDQYRIRNPKSGLELTLTADFDSRVVRYHYAALSGATAGVPDGGMLSIRQSPRGAAEFYSADERLTSEETRRVLLGPVLFPPQIVA